MSSKQDSDAYHDQAVDREAEAAAGRTVLAQSHMTKERAIHELVSWATGTRAILWDVQEAIPDNERVNARLREIELLLKSVEQFKPTAEQLNLWSAERRQEGGWNP